MPEFDLVEDDSLVQATVLHAALAGDPDCLARLPALVPAFDEPYRYVAAEVVRLADGGGYVDGPVLAAALAGRRLTRRPAGGPSQQVPADQAVNLVTHSPAKPGQAAAYLTLLEARLEARRRAELQDRLRAIFDEFRDDPGRLAAEMGRVAGSRLPADAVGYRSELLEILPYALQLEQQPSGADFLGLDSGFPHLNFLCNGLDTGLFILAAQPGEGKTTLVWQMCCQAALRNPVPVVFASFEQSKRELRAKALARLGKLEYRHLLRGKVRPGDPDAGPRLLDALNLYAEPAARLTVVEADDTTTVDQLREIVRAKMAERPAGRCLLAVDYLQVVPLAGADAGRVTSPKDRIDLHVSALRRLARDLNVSVLAISSENRAGYESKKLDVFKESGGIEYAADVAGVLTRGEGEPPTADNPYRFENLNVVKNRNGECGVVKFKFYPRRAEFVETGKGELT